jgi:hypothetical protein
MSESTQNGAPITANFMQYVGQEGMIDFVSYVRDKETAFSQLKVVFLTLPDSNVGTLIYKEDGQAIAIDTEYKIDQIKYAANGDTVQEFVLNYYVVDSAGFESNTKRATINAIDEQKTNNDTQLIGTGHDDILIADSYGAYYIWGAGGSDTLVGNEGQNTFIIDHSSTKSNQTITTIANLKILEDKIDLSHLICVQNINDINIDSKSNNTQITFKDNAKYPQEILLEKTIPATVSENHKEIFVFNNNKNDIKSKCDTSIVDKIITSEYSFLAAGIAMGMVGMKIISCISSCIFGKFEKTTDININLPDASTIASNTARSMTFYDNNVPIGITFEEGREIELISLKDSNTYFKYNEVASKTSWVSKSDGILFYDYNKSMSADSKNIVMTEWSKNAKTDFEAVLEVFDTNQDKIFDSKDDKFSDFYVWQDKNSNGAVEEGELKSLKEHGIHSINFNESRVSSEEQQEQGILNVATVEWEDGKITNAYDLVFTAEVVIE